MLKSLNALTLGYSKSTRISRLNWGVYFKLKVAKVVQRKIISSTYED